MTRPQETAFNNKVSHLIYQLATFIHVIKLFLENY